MLLFVVYYSHKVRERATSKPTLRDVGNLHEPYKSPPLCQRLTLIAIALAELLTARAPFCLGKFLQRSRACRFSTVALQRAKASAPTNKCSVTGEQMFGEQPGSVEDFFSEQMFCPNKARDHRPRAYVQECGATYPVVVVCYSLPYSLQQLSHHS